MLVTHPVRARAAARPSESMRFASAVAGFGMLLRDSPNAGSLTWDEVLDARARRARRRGWLSRRLHQARRDRRGTRSQVARRRRAAAERDRSALDRICGVAGIIPHARLPASPLDYDADGVRTITLDRADKLNAVNGALAAARRRARRCRGRRCGARRRHHGRRPRLLRRPRPLGAARASRGTRAERLDPYAWVGRGYSAWSPARSRSSPP